MCMKPIHIVEQPYRNWRSAPVQIAILHHKQPILSDSHKNEKLARSSTPLLANVDPKNFRSSTIAFIATLPHVAFPLNLLTFAISTLTTDSCLSHKLKVHRLSHWTSYKLKSPQTQNRECAQNPVNVLYYSEYGKSRCGPKPEHSKKTQMSSILHHGPAPCRFFPQCRSLHYKCVLH